ncbi:MAG: kelch repeat-containing protein [Myxococcota bacterium]
MPPLRLRALAALAFIVALAGCATSGQRDRHLADWSAPIETPSGSALLAAMPVGLTSFGAASDGRYAYIVGGYHGAPHAYTASGQSRALSRLPLSGAGEWEELATMPAGLQGTALVEHAGALCRFGGMRVTGDGPDATMLSVDEAACVAPGERVWRALPSLPAGRSSLAAVTVGAEAYVVGGWRLEGGAGSGVFASDMLARDLADPAAPWRAVPTPFQRRALCVASAGGRVVAAGGMSPDRQVSRQVDVFDPATAGWSRGPDLPGDGFGVACVGVGDAVYASGRDGVLYRWRVGEAAWVNAGRLVFPRFFHALLPAADGSLVAIGGIDGMHTHGRTRVVERVVPDTRQTLTWLELGYPGAARNRQAATVDGDYLYLFGGNRSLGQHDFTPADFLDEGWRLHIPSLTWTRRADLPVRRQSMQTARVGAQIWMMGGFGNDGAGAVSHADGYGYAPTDDAFQPGLQLPGDRTQFGMVQTADAIWVFGGLSYAEGRPAGDFLHFDSVMRASLDAPERGFTTVDARIPSGPRRAFAAAAHDGFAYLVGGMREGFKVVDDCVRFEFATSTFTPMTCPSRPRVSADLVAVGGRLWLVGGSTIEGRGLASDTRVEVYDPATDRWAVAIEALPFDTRHMRALAWGERLLLVSTHQENARMRVAIVETDAGPLPSLAAEAAAPEVTER